MHDLLIDQANKKSGEEGIKCEISSRIWNGLVDQKILMELS